MTRKSKTSSGFKNATTHKMIIVVFQANLIFIFTTSFFGNNNSFGNLYFPRYNMIFGSSTYLAPMTPV